MTKRKAVIHECSKQRMRALADYTTEELMQALIIHIEQTNGLDFVDDATHVKLFNLLYF